MSRAATVDGPLVSVIVPVFEVREFVAQCLASITGQTYPTLEIIEAILNHVEQNLS